MHSDIFHSRKFDHVQQLTDLVCAAAGDDTLKGRTWVLLSEAADGC
jgi:hypothetical protein